MQAFQPHILAIEDDPVLGLHLKTSLERAGFVITVAADGDSGLILAQRVAYDLILLDVMLPGIDGMELLRRLRCQRVTPVLMMSAQGDEGHRIAGFDGGADDYLPKPFSTRELQVRIAAILRRVAYERERDCVVPPAANDDLVAFDEPAMRVRCGDCWLSVTPTEFRLLQVLYEQMDEVLTKAFLYQQVLRRGYARHDRVLDMHISNLRRKLARAGIHNLRLESVWGRGYLLSWQVS
ncbi:response regulator transcription factor [Halopseudomonas aestusnigri]|uniref:Two-component system, OmpR family, response regulator PfeR n=1 Tax=Halopseudomonas aestusnigri TaxID=857252 RepID=A0AAQ1JQ90_9GAMM|nr:response regulator transcription factor [Halopseudomonas aestusnigri]SEG39723.1 two-component system, OmpR family, response regulator PfeR [Halopseudomonas aestusnigri]